MKSFKPKNSAGHEGISGRLLKLGEYIFSKPFSHMCNSSWRLKYSIVKPIKKKKGDKTNMTNYRPISLLTTFSKILETVKYNRLN